MSGVAGEASAGVGRGSGAWDAMEGKSHVKISQPEYRFPHLLVRSPEAGEQRRERAKGFGEQLKESRPSDFWSFDTGPCGSWRRRVHSRTQCLNLEAPEWPAGSAGSPASTSIAGAGVAASGETGTAAPESSGKVISMSVLLGGGGGAEEAEGR